MIQDDAIPEDDDLSLSPRYDCLFQRDTTRLVDYDEAYFDHYEALRGTPIARRLNDFRVRFAQSRCNMTIFDFGVGSGEFIEAWADAGKVAFGYDVNPFAVAMLKGNNAYVDPFAGPVHAGGWTMWDVLEHLPRPWEVLDLIRPGQYLFLSLPVFHSLADVRSSRHYKPGEHLYYFTPAGLVRFATDCGFRLLEATDEETRIGRDGIMSFAFRKE